MSRLAKDVEHLTPGHPFREMVKVMYRDPYILPDVELPRYIWDKEISNDHMLEFLAKNGESV